jgi:hypothetical protein
MGKLVSQDACKPDTSGSHQYLNYSGGRDQEDLGSKPAQANNFRDPISKKPFTKKGWWSVSRCRPWVPAPVPHTHTKCIYFSNNLKHVATNQMSIWQAIMDVTILSLYY